MAQTAYKIVEAGWSRPCGGTTQERLGFIAEEISKALVAENEECAAIAEAVGRELGEPAIGHAIAEAIRKLNEPQ